MTRYRRNDDLFGTITVEIPNGYRPIGTLEMARRRAQCAETDDWSDLERATLYDPTTGEHLPISAGPYRWRVFVEPR